MKRLVLRNILMYVISFALFIVPLFFFDYFSPLYSPLYLQWIAPLFLIYANVSCDLKQKSLINIWRVVPTCAVIVGAYFLDNSYTEWYYLKVTNDLPDPFTYLLGKYFYLASFILVVGFICLYQLYKIVVEMYNRHKKLNVKEN